MIDTNIIASAKWIVPRIVVGIFVNEVIHNPSARFGTVGLHSRHLPICILNADCYLRMTGCQWIHLIMAINA